MTTRVSRIDLGPLARENLAIYSNITDNSKLAYFTLNLNNHVAAVDISYLNNVKRLDNPDEARALSDLTISRSVLTRRTCL